MTLLTNRIPEFRCEPVRVHDSLLYGFGNVCGRIAMAPFAADCGGFERRLQIHVLRASTGSSRTGMAEQALRCDRAKKVRVRVILVTRRHVVSASSGVPRYRGLEQRVLYPVNVTFTLISRTDYPYRNIGDISPVTRSFVKNLI